MTKAILTATFALMLSVATRDAAADDTAAVDAQIKTTLGEIRRVATELAALRAALADSTAPAPGGGRTAGDSTAPSPGGTPAADASDDAPTTADILGDIHRAYGDLEQSIEVQLNLLIGRIKAAEAQVAQLEQQMASLLRARAAKQQGSLDSDGKANQSHQAASRLSRSFGTGMLAKSGL